MPSPAVEEYRIVPCRWLSAPVELAVSCRHGKDNYTAGLGGDEMRNYENYIHNLGLLLYMWHNNNKNLTNSISNVDTNMQQYDNNEGILLSKAISQQINICRKITFSL